MATAPLGGDAPPRPTITGADLVARVRKAVSDGVTLVELDGHDIHGDVSLSCANLPVGIRLTHCTVAGTIDVQCASLLFLDLGASRLRPEPTDGRRVAVHAEGVHVAHDVSLEGADSIGALMFARGQIDGWFDATLLRCRLDDEEPPPYKPVGEQPPEELADRPWALDLTNGAVKHDLLLERASLDGGLSLAGCSIGGQLNATAARFVAPDAAATDRNRYALWAQRADVGESALMRGDRDDGDVREIQFVGSVALLGAHFGGDLQVELASFDLGRDAHADDRPPQRDALDLQRIDAQVLIFRSVRIIRGELNLKNATVKVLRDDPGSWTAISGRYSLGGFAYDELATKYPDGDGPLRDWTPEARRNWVGNASDSDLPGPYLALAAVEAAAGNPADERRARIKASYNAATPLERRLLGWVCFGYRPWRVIFPLLALALVTGAVFWVALDTHGAIVEAKPSTPVVQPNHCDGAKTACPNRLIYALDAVSPVDLGQKSTWRPNAHTVVGRALAWLLVVDIFASWALAGILLAAVAGWLKRTP